MKRGLAILFCLLTTTILWADGPQMEAEKRIDSYRKQDVALTVLHDGKPVEGAIVKIEMTRHEFLFGCNIFMWGNCDTAEQNEQYQTQFADVFNFATIGFYSWSFEPVQGKRQYERIGRVLDWCEKNNIRAKGHPLAWNFMDPSWAKNLSENELYHWQLEYVLQCPQHYCGRINTWDVINEVVHWDRDDCWQQAPKLTALMKSHGAIEYAKTCFREARKGNPDAMLLINDYMSGAEYAALIEQLTDENGKPLYDTIGQQSHMHTDLWNNERIWTTCERFAKFKSPIHFTELTILSSSDKFHWGQSGGLPTTPEGEQKQAEEIVRVYTMLFSHPSVEAITWWDLSDQGAWMNVPAGLLRKDMTPKPAYEALRKLVRETWATHEILKTDAKGKTSFRAFRGEYNVTVTLPDGKERLFPATVDRNENRLEFDCGK